jgi:hypothetical protein
VNDAPYPVALVPGVPTSLTAVGSAESETYLGLLIMAAFWALLSGAVVAVSEHEVSRRAALGWVASFAVATLVAAFFFGMLL